MATSNPYSNYVFFNPFPDAGLMVSQPYLNGRNEFDVYIEQYAKKMDGRANAKNYSIRNHNPHAGGGLSAFGPNLCLYICAHGEMDETTLVGQIDYPREPATIVGKSEIFYPLKKLSGNRYRYSLMAIDLISVLAWEGLAQGVAEIRFWACRSAAATYASVFAAMAITEGRYPNAKIYAYDGDLSFGAGGRKECTPIGQQEIQRAKSLMKAVAPHW